MWTTVVTNMSWIKFYLCEKQCHIWIRVNEIYSIKEKASDCSLSEITLSDGTHYVVQDNYNDIIKIIISDKD